MNAVSLDQRNHLCVRRRGNFCLPERYQEAFYRFIMDVLTLPLEPNHRRRRAAAQAILNTIHQP